ncbi:hypothetical protein [Nitrosomonas marina]|nr:hypothetical protein [Nitrosomonas marina]
MAGIDTMPHCHHTTKSHFPADLYGKKQYGSGFKARVVNLLLCLMVA